MLRVFSPTASFIISTLLLTACGGGGGGGSSGGTGLVSFGITDSPVTDAQNVVVSFDCLELKSANSGRITFEFDPPEKIDLLQLQGNEFAKLITDELVPSGQYQ